MPIVIWWWLSSSIRDKTPHIPWNLEVSWTCPFKLCGNNPISYNITADLFYYIPWPFFLLHGSGNAQYHCSITSSMKGKVPFFKNPLIWYSRLNFKTFVLNLDYIRYYLNLSTLLLALSFIYNFRLKFCDVSLFFQFCQKSLGFQGYLYMQERSCTFCVTFYKKSL